MRSATDAARQTRLDGVLRRDWVWVKPKHHKGLFDRVPQERRCRGSCSELSGTETLNQNHDDSKSTVTRIIM